MSPKKCTPANMAALRNGSMYWRLETRGVLGLIYQFHSVYILRGDSYTLWVGVSSDLIYIVFYLTCNNVTIMYSKWDRPRLYHSESLTIYGDFVIIKQKLTLKLNENEVFHKPVLKSLVYRFLLAVRYSMQQGSVIWFEYQFVYIFWRIYVWRKTSINKYYSKRDIIPACEYLFMEVFTFFKR